MGEKKLVSRNIAIALGLIVAILAFAVVTLALNPKLPTNESNDNSQGAEEKGVIPLQISMAFSSTSGDKLMYTCAVYNSANQMAYNCKLHIVGVYPNGFKALDTYIPIGNEGVITANTYLSGVPSGGLIPFTYQANSGEPIWTVTAEGTTAP